MSLRGRAHKVVDLLLDPGMSRGLVSWPKFSMASYRIVKALAKQGVQARSVIDAGANVGQFCVAAVKLLQPVCVYAFEPLPAAYGELTKHVKGLQGVRAENVALGERRGEVEFHVNAHSHSSSILPLGEAHRAAFPEAVETDIIRVPITTIDDALEGSELPRPCLLKLDVQGYEDRVLEGASRTLEAVDYIVAELSFTPMYKGERVFAEMVDLMKEHGFRFVRPLDLLRDPVTEEILQFDGLFERAGE